MQINVSPLTEAVIAQLVSVGAYATPEEVVEEAVALVDLKQKIDRGCWMLVQVA